MSCEAEIPPAEATPCPGGEEWQRILPAAPTSLAHEFWCAIARSVAREHLLALQGVSTDTLDDRVEELVSEWLDDSLPAGDDLGLILGELDYFRGIDMSWDEKVSFSGEACGYLADATSDLKSLVERYPDAEAAITEELVEWFYSDWRSRFFSRVLREAEGLARSRSTEASPALGGSILPPATQESPGATELSPIGLASWIIGALGVGAWSEAKPAMDELCSAIQADSALSPKHVSLLVKDLRAARAKLSSGFDSWFFSASEEVVMAMHEGLRLDIERTPFLKSETRQRVLAELKPLGRRGPELLMTEIIVMRALVEAIVVLDCYEGLDLSVASRLNEDALARNSRLADVIEDSFFGESGEPSG